jgi:phage baseplate assembly protein W
MELKVNVFSGPYSINFAPNSVLEEILQNVRNIFQQVKGTIPYQRDMGIDESIIDLPTENAIMIYQIDIIKQIKKFEPRAKVKKFNWKGSDIVKGNLNLVITIDVKEGYL